MASVWATVPEARPARVERLRLVTTDDIQGARIRNPDGEDIGSIRTYVLDLNSGAIIYAVLAYGGVLGIGEKYFAIPWEAMIPEPREGVYYVNLSRERLENLPGFDKDAWPIAGNWALIEPSRPGSSRWPLQGEVRGPALVQATPPEPSRAARSGDVITEEVRFPELSQAVRPQEGVRPVTPIEPVEVPGAARPYEELLVLIVEPCAPAGGVEEVAESPGRTAYMHLSAADLQHYLKGVDYPTDKRGLITKAREHGASPGALEALRRFDERDYRSAIDVSREFGRLK